MSQPVVSCNNGTSHQPQSSGGTDTFGIVVATAVSCSSTITSYPTLQGSNGNNSLPSATASDLDPVPETPCSSGFDRSRHTPVIVAPNVPQSSSSSSASCLSLLHASEQQQQQQHHPHSATEVPPFSCSATLYSATSGTSATVAAVSSPYITAQTYLSGETSITACGGASPAVLHQSCCGSNSNFIYPSNFFQPYYGLSPTLSEFNVLQMCCQPLLSEIASQGTDISPTAESLYGFANRLHPITPPGAHHQLNMPQAYQTRASAGYVGNAMTRPDSATGKRGGRRPKEYEEYDHVNLSEEERDKRDKRRLRNKEAAARCRQRRLDLMGSLQTQVDQLKEENKMKDTKIAELQLLKNELIAVIRNHHCVLPDSLRQTLDIDMSSTQQYMPRGAASVPVAAVTTATEIGPPYPASASPQTLLNRKRPASEMIPELRHPTQPTGGPQPLSTSVTLNSSGNETSILTLAKAPSMQIKQEPTLFDVNGRDLPDEEIKRPTSLSFTSEGVTTTTTYSSLSSSGVPITTPSNLIGGAASDFGAVNLLDGPTGLTPCHPPQATAFQLSSLATPLGEGRSFETL